MKTVSELNIKNNTDRIFLVSVGIALTLSTVLLRFIVRDLPSTDMIICLLPWYDIYKANGGFRAIGYTVGNYNYLYSLLIIILTYIPIEAIHAYKVLSGLFDYLTAFTVMYLTGILTAGSPRREKYMLASYAFVIFSPIVLQNSAVWGQCDSMLAFFVILALVCIIREKYIACCIALGMALAIKLQMIFIMPLILYVYIVRFREKRFRFGYFVIVPATLWLTSVPHIIGGGGILDCFMVYLSQGTGQSDRLYENIGCFWALFVPDSRKAAEAGIQFPVLLFVFVAFAVLAAFFVYCHAKKVELTPLNLTYMSFLCIFICVFFLPHMRDRYGYIYEILAIVLCFTDRKTILPLIMIYISTLARYNSYLWGIKLIPVWGSAALNLLALSAYFLLFAKRISAEKQEAKTKAKVS